MDFIFFDVENSSDRLKDVLKHECDNVITSCLVPDANFNRLVKGGKTVISTTFEKHKKDKADKHMLGLLESMFYINGAGRVYCVTQDKKLRTEVIELCEQFHSSMVDL